MTDGGELSRAVALVGGSPVEWVDSFTGETLTATEVANIGCEVVAPCSLTDPATLQWVDNGDGTFSKDLGQGFVITGGHDPTSHPTTVINGPQCSPPSPASMLSFNAAAPCSYPLNDPSRIVFTATRPWPAPFAIEVFDIDGTSNTAKHGSPNETVAPSWGIPDSVSGPHPQTYRDKGAGQIGANGAPGNGRRFTLNYNNPPQGPMTFDWHGCCIAYDFSLPANC